MHKTFTTSGPASLYVEIGSGRVTLRATDTTETDVRVEGRDADDVTVEERGDEIVVIARPGRGGFLGFGSDLTVEVTLPHDSELTTKLGSADLRATGRLGTARVKSGSGDVELDELTADAVIQTGSGDVNVRAALADLRVKAGSGHVQVGRLAAPTAIVSGSGRISVDTAEAETVAKTGSGDIRVGVTTGDVSVTSGSGDLEVGSISRGVVKAKTASGDVQVGVPGGIPVWTDISSVSGDVASNLVDAGEPADGQEYVEIRATTVSGDVILTQL